MYLGIGGGDAIGGRGSEENQQEDTKRLKHSVGGDGGDGSDTVSRTCMDRRGHRIGDGGGCAAGCNSDSGIGRQSGDCRQDSWYRWARARRQSHRSGGGGWLFARHCSRCRRWWHRIGNGGCPQWLFARYCSRCRQWLFGECGSRRRRWLCGMHWSWCTPGSRCRRRRHAPGTYGSRCRRWRKNGRQASTATGQSVPAMMFGW